MKKFKLKLYLAALVGSMTLFTGCEEDRLDLKPIMTDVLENSVRSEEEVKLYLADCYNQLSSSTIFGANLLIHADMMSDNTFVSNKNDGYFTGINSLNITVDGDLGHLAALYRVVRSANTVLHYENYLAPNVDPSTFNQELIRQYQAEAKATRALALFYAAQLYGSNPTSGMHQEYGIPVYDDAFDPNMRYPRSSVAETYEFIIRDLEEALPYMAETPANKGYLSKTAVNLLLAKVHLTRGGAGDYQKALDYANSVIAVASPTGAFNFVSKDDYANYFSSTDVNLSEDQPETVWEVNFTSSDNPGINEAMGAFYARTGAHGSILFRQSFYDVFDAGDVRRSLLTQNGAPVEDTPKGFWTTKWPRNTSEGNFTMNVKVLRMSEARLIKAEALYRLGQNAAALAELNSFAATRGATTQYTGSDLLTDIMNERRKEFFAEGQRFFDLKRNNMGYVKDTNCAGVNCTVDAGSRFFVLPMPNTSELLLNPLMTQHPLWQ